MQIITAGRTAPNKLVCFGGADTPLDARGSRDVEALRTSVDFFGSALRCGPEAAVVQTVRLLGCEPIIDDALRGLDVGRWDGLRPEDVPIEELGTWFSDPTSNPHGGETVAAFVERISTWREQCQVDVVVVAKSVAQALLCGDIAHFFATELRLGTRYDEGR
ncbi:hypothetical protein GOEFS_060_00490 [Gordonia effusa NBRC 100432]|uniref:Phosphoglycerate mutase family protein n=1 Tax=Gordonia effusa NBRC 100432 TaxID=1077974 RepID=H0R0Q5_9ACTN|nr:hypothetical protein GOEFS_060_00490 [Gordonia effusa NBRC 100432]